MTIIKDVLKEELARLEELCKVYEEEIRSFPQGSLNEKERNGKTYIYLVYRKNGKLEFDYIGKKESAKVHAMKTKIIERKKTESLLKSVKKNLKEINYALRKRKQRASI